MRQFTDNKPLMRFIENNDVEEIKEELPNLIFFLQGDRNELQKAIAYVLQHTSLKFEQHQNIEVENTSDIKTLLTEEQFNLRKNFSKERFEKLIDLYNQTYKTKNNTPILDSGKNVFHRDTNKKEDNTLKIIAIAAGTIFLGYILYKILD